jgi:proteic killer suppression protein
MIKTFADKYTQELYETGKSKKFPPNIHSRAVRKLDYINLAKAIEELKVPSGNKLHALGRDRSGQHAIAINDQWRICFSFQDKNAYDVEVCDYH